LYDHPNGQGNDTLTVRQKSKICNLSIHNPTYGLSLDIEIYQSFVDFGSGWLCLLTLSFESELVVIYLHWTVLEGWINGSSVKDA